MKLTRMHLRKIIQEAMYDPRTLSSDMIPKSMIALDNEDFKEKISTISGTKGGSIQAKDLIHSLDGEPAVIDLAGGYKGAIKKADRMKTRALFDDTKHFIHNIYPVRSEIHKVYHDFIKSQYNNGILMTQDDVINDIFNMNPETFFEGMWYYYLTDQGHEDPEYVDSTNHEIYGIYLKFIEQELRKFYTADRIEKIAIGEL